MEKQNVLNNIIQSSRVTVIICKYVLSELDKKKKFSGSARDAIRWIETTIANKRLRLSTISDISNGVEDETVKFLDEKKLLYRKDLFATILKLNNNENDLKTNLLEKYSSKILLYP